MQQQAKCIFHQLDSRLIFFFSFYGYILTNEENSLHLVRLFDFHPKILTESWPFLYIRLHQQITDLFYSTCTLINGLIWNETFAILATFSDGFLATIPPQMLTLIRCSLSFKGLMFCILSKTKLIPLHIYYSVSVKCLYTFSKCLFKCKMIDSEKYPKIQHQHNYKNKKKLLHSQK